LPATIEGGDDREGAMLGERWLRHIGVWDEGGSSAMPLCDLPSAIGFRMRGEARSGFGMRRKLDRVLG